MGVRAWADDREAECINIFELCYKVLKAAIDKNSESKFICHLIIKAQWLQLYEKTGLLFIKESYNFYMQMEKKINKAPKISIS